MANKALFEEIGKLGFLPALAVSDVDTGLRSCETLLEAGLPVAEITFRTEAAGETIRLASERFPELMVGAGTVLTLDQLRQTIDYGAKFALTPGSNPKIISAAVDAGFPIVPGITTPSDIELNLEFGLRVLKFFPAEFSGGIPYLKSIAAPYRHLGIKFIPTGGINGANYREYLAEEIILAVSGTWLVDKKKIQAGNWTGVSADIRESIIGRDSVRSSL